MTFAEFLPSWNAGMNAVSASALIAGWTAIRRGNRQLHWKLMAAAFDGGVTKVVGIEARGFILAAPIAQALGAGLVPVRKPGKLPWDTHAHSYELEYGSDALEVHRDALVADDRVLVVDDVLATGGTAEAACELVSEFFGPTIVGVSVLLEIASLRGRERVARHGYPVAAVLHV